MSDELTRAAERCPEVAKVVDGPVRSSMVCEWVPRDSTLAALRALAALLPVPCGECVWRYVTTHGTTHWWYCRNETSIAYDRAVNPDDYCSAGSRTQPSEEGK